MLKFPIIYARHEAGETVQDAQGVAHAQHARDLAESQSPYFYPEAFQPKANDIHGVLYIFPSKSQFEHSFKPLAEGESVTQEEKSNLLTFDDQSLILQVKFQLFKAILSLNDDDTCQSFSPARLFITRKPSNRLFFWPFKSLMRLKSLVNT